MTNNTEANLLEVRNLTKVFQGAHVHGGRLVAVDNVSISIPKGKAHTIAIAGESGSGKTTLAMMILDFLAPSSGNILYDGTDIQAMSKSTYFNYRREVQAVFQDPYETFNPFYKIDHILNVTIGNFRLARGSKNVRQTISEALEVVQLDPGQILGKYPHQLSGGQLQRVMLARAFMLKPKLLVADEPVSMIDVSLRTIILDIMMSLKLEYGISQLYITHDLSTALQISDEIIILYSGSVVEQGDAETVIQNPQHPYTKLLVRSIPLPDPENRWGKEEKIDLREDLIVTKKPGCKFYDRCPVREDACLAEQPPLYRISEKQSAACILYR